MQVSFIEILQAVPLGEESESHMDLLPLVLHLLARRGSFLVAFHILIVLFHSCLKQLFKLENWQLEVTATF